MIEKKLIILSVLPFLLIIVSIISVNMIDFSPTLTEKEQQVLNFTYETIGITWKKTLVGKNHLKSPLEISETPAELPYPSLFPSVLKSIFLAVP